ncbi:ABC transporter ATP-binding protein [Patescibacteria group bacterium]
MKLNTQRTFRFYWKHVKKFKFLSVVLVIVLLGATAASLIAPYYYKVLFDLIVDEGVRSDIANQLVGILAIIFGYHFLEWFFWRIAVIGNIYLQSRVMGNIANECFERLHNHSYNFFTSNFTGSLVKKVNRMVHSFESIADNIYYELVPLVLKVVVIFIVLFTIQPLLGIVMIIWTFLFVLFNLLFSRYKWKYDIIKAKAGTKTTAQLADTITNSITIKLFAGLKHEVKKFVKIYDDWVKKTRKAWNLDEIARAVQHFAIIALEFIVFFIAIKYWTEGDLTAGDFIWVQAYLITLFEKIWGFGRIMRNMFRDFADAEEMTEILNTKLEIQDAKDAKKLSIVRGKIEFQKVRFSYDKTVKVIKKLDLKIKSGEKIALVGPSGGGKTTVTKLILRFFDIQRGKILIDGQNIKSVTQDSLRSQISLVPQDPILFHRTLLDNIKYGRRNASEEEVIAASKLAHCHEFIQKFPEKYETLVGERGVKLSGGERQRVAIARAILANNPILILDEATSSLDSYSESQIQKALANLMKNKTTLIIAHRLSTIMSADRIIVFQDGDIVESGTHADLISDKSGLYKKLWDLQSGGYVKS